MCNVLIFCRYADGVDLAMVLLAFAAAVTNGEEASPGCTAVHTLHFLPIKNDSFFVDWFVGALVPVFSIIFGGLVNSLGGGTADLVDAVNK